MPGQHLLRGGFEVTSSSQLRNGKRHSRMRHAGDCAAILPRRTPQLRGAVDAHTASPWIYRLQASQKQLPRVGEADSSRRSSSNTHPWTNPTDAHACRGPQTNQTPRRYARLDVRHALLHATQCGAARGCATRGSTLSKPTPIRKEEGRASSGGRSGGRSGRSSAGFLFWSAARQQHRGRCRRALPWHDDPGGRLERSARPSRPVGGLARKPARGPPARHAGFAVPQVGLVGGHGRGRRALGPAVLFLHSGRRSVMGLSIFLSGVARIIHPAARYAKTVLLGKEARKARGCMWGPPPRMVASDVWGRMECEKFNERRASLGTPLRWG
jgi:hypothetical protein